MPLQTPLSTSIQQIVHCISLINYMNPMKHMIVDLFISAGLGIPLLTTSIQTSFTKREESCLTFPHFLLSPLVGQELNLRLVLVKTSQPVSYTHLDVYKRQILSNIDGSGRVQRGIGNSLQDVYKRQVQL